MEYQRWTAATGAVCLELDSRHDRVPGPGGEKVSVRIVERQPIHGCAAMRASIWLHGKDKYSVTLYEGRDHKDSLVKTKKWAIVQRLVNGHLAKVDRYLEREQSLFRMPGLDELFKKPERSGKVKRGDLVVLRYPIEAYLEDEQMPKREGTTYRCPQVVEGQLGVVMKEKNGKYPIQYSESGNNYDYFDEDEFEVIDNVGLEASQMWHYYKDEVEADPIYQLGLKHGTEEGKQQLSHTIQKNVRELLKGIDPNLAYTIFGPSAMMMRGPCGMF